MDRRRARRRAGASCSRSRRRCGSSFGDAESLDDATSGRYELVRGGLELAGDRPLWGFGSGSFAEEYLEHGFGARSDAVSASHTIPLTVAAEQGIIGLGVYLALLVAALSRLLHRARNDPWRAYVAAGFVAVVVHTWMYAAFLEDPVTWALLAVGAALARRPRHRRPSQPALGAQPCPTRCRAPRRAPRPAAGRAAAPRSSTSAESSPSAGSSPSCQTSAPAWRCDMATPRAAPGGRRTARSRAACRAASCASPGGGRRGTRARAAGRRARGRRRARARRRARRARRAAPRRARAGRNSSSRAGRSSTSSGVSG